MSNSLNNMAFGLFRQWTNHASKEYPDFAFDIVDERILVKDLEDTLELALDNLVKNEKKKKRAMPGYDYGFILGFIQGNLSTKWGFEYITKRSKTYKHIVINKALLEYLRFDFLAGIRIKAVYEKMYEDTVNLESLDYDLPNAYLPDLDITLMQEGSLSNMEQNPVLVFLESQLYTQLLHLKVTNTKDFLPDVRSVVDQKFVLELIRSKENA